MTGVSYPNPVKAGIRGGFSGALSGLFVGLFFFAVAGDHRFRNRPSYGAIT